MPAWEPAFCFRFSYIPNWLSFAQEWSYDMPATARLTNSELMQVGNDLQMYFLWWRDSSALDQHSEADGT
jgi:hypothetical protein